MFYGPVWFLCLKQITSLRWICQVSWLSPCFPLVLQTRGPSLLYSLARSPCLTALLRVLHAACDVINAVIRATPAHSCKKKKPYRKFFVTCEMFPPSMAFSSQAHRNTSFSSFSLFSLNFCFCVLLSVLRKKGQLAPDGACATGSRGGQQTSESDPVPVLRKSRPAG